MKERFESLVEHLLAGNMFLEEAIEILERAMIQRTMENTAGNQSEASKRLGIHRNTLQRKMVQYGMGNGRARPRRKTAGRQSGSPRKPKSGAA
jgi:DNA-binding NtrC family response regulator